MSVGCLEPPFFKEFIGRFVGSLPHDFNVANGWKPSIESQQDQDEWPKLKQFLTEGFLTNTRDYWASVFQGRRVEIVRVLSSTDSSLQGVMRVRYRSLHLKKHVHRCP